MQSGAASLAAVTSHVIFTNGLLDPWSSQSVTANVSRTLVAINIPDGSHHSDLGAPPNPYPLPTDSAHLRAARAQQLTLLRTWLRELESSHPPPVRTAADAPSKATAATAASSASAASAASASMVPSATTAATASVVGSTTSNITNAPRVHATAPPPQNQPPPPPQEPPSMPTKPHFDPIVVADVFFGACGGFGLLLLLFGQKAWRVFLALVAFTVSGGVCGYVLLYDTTGLKVWASLLISVAVAFAVAVVAYFLSVVGLVCFAGLGGLVLTALPLRLFAPGLSPHLRVALIGTGAAVGMALTALGVFKCRNRADEEEQSGLVTQAPSATEQRARSKLRSATSRKLLEAAITSTVGAYAVILCINQWWHEREPVECRSLQLPALLNVSSVLPPCHTSPCLILICLALGLLLLGCCFQSVGICRAHRSRSDERTSLNALQEPLDDEGGGGRRGPGQPTSLSTRMRQKYCGGAAASSSAAAASSIQPIMRRDDSRPPPNLGGRRVFGGSAPRVEQPLAVRPVASPGAASQAPVGLSMAGGGEEPPAGSNPFAVGASPSAPAPAQRTLDPNLPAWAQRG